MEPESAFTRGFGRDKAVKIGASAAVFALLPDINIIERNGADVTSTVSFETDFLVRGENPGSSKLENAEENNVEVIDADEFRERFLDRLSK